MDHKTRWTRTPENWTEFWHDFADLNRIIRTWNDVGISTGCSTNGDETRADYLHGIFMVHGYTLRGFPDCPYGFTIRTKFPVDHSWFFNLHEPLDRALLDEGFAVSPKDGMEITHHLHNGPGKISFGVRMADEDIYLRYLRGDFGRMKLRELKRAYDYAVDP